MHFDFDVIGAFQLFQLQQRPHRVAAEAELSGLVPAAAADVFERQVELVLRERGEGGEEVEVEVEVVCFVAVLFLVEQEFRKEMKSPR